MSTRLFVIAALLLLLPLPALAQHRDPLTDRETNQLRDTNYEPAKRIKLFLDFAKARLIAAEQLRSAAAPAADTGQRIRGLLEDFGNIMDELSDNLDMYANERHDDIRAPLKAVIEADQDFQLRLRAMKQAAGADAKFRAASRDYNATLDDALDSVNGSADDARQALQQQEEAAGAAKKEKKR